MKKICENTIKHDGKSIEGGVKYMMRSILDPKVETQLYDRASKKLGKGTKELIVEYEGLVQNTSGSRHGYGRLIVHESHSYFESDDEDPIEYSNKLANIDALSDNSADWQFDEGSKKWTNVKLKPGLGTSGQKTIDSPRTAETDLNFSKQ